MSANVEVGAGTTEFGRKFFPPCVLTDVDEELVQRHGFQGNRVIDIVCAAEALAFRTQEFERVIVCNPWRYGFRREEDSHRPFAQRPGGARLPIVRPGAAS